MHLNSEEKAEIFEKYGKSKTDKRSDLEAEYGKSASVLLNMVMHCEKQIEKL